QTCALPILARRRVSSRCTTLIIRRIQLTCCCVKLPDGILFQLIPISLFSTDSSTHERIGSLAPTRTLRPNWRHLSKRFANWTTLRCGCCIQGYCKRRVSSFSKPVAIAGRRRHYYRPTHLPPLTTSRPTC